MAAAQRTAREVETVTAAMKLKTESRSCRLDFAISSGFLIPPSFRSPGNTCDGRWKQSS